MLSNLTKAVLGVVWLVVVSKATLAGDDAPRELAPQHVLTVGERVFAVAISPDGSTIAAGGGGGTGLFSEGARSASDRWLP